MGMLKTKRQATPSSVALADTHDTIARATCLLRPPAGLKVDFGLIEQDAGDLVTLTREAGRGGGFNPARLGKRRKRWESLVERATGEDGLFEGLRTDAEFKAEAARLAREAAKPPRRVRYEQEGAVVLPGAELLDWLTEKPPVVWVEHVAVLAMVLMQLENVRAIAPQSRIEGSGDEAVLVVAKRFGLAGGDADPDSRLIRWRDCLGDLQRLEWLVVEQAGSEVRVSRGRRALEIVKGRSS
jgi:hypothetical protein